MRIRWTPAALADLQHINDYLKEHHPQYRQPTMRKLYESVSALKQWRQRGRRGREDGTRELPFSPLPYVVVYRVTAECVEVVRIYHSAQDRPYVHRPIPSIRGGFQPLDAQAILAKCL